MASDLAEVINRSMPCQPTTLKQLLLDSARAFPERTAVVALHQSANLFPAVSPGDGSAQYLRCTYAELLQGAQLLAASLQRHGIERGDPIASLQLNGADWALGFWAAAMLECPWIAVQPKSATNKDEIRHIIDISKPRVLLTSNEEQISQLQGSLPDHNLETLVKICAAPSETVPHGWASLSSMLSQPSTSLELGLEASMDAAEDLALMLFTSGTTGQPKGCMHTHTSLTNMFRNHAHSLNLNEASAAISHLTLSHCFGMLYSCSFWSRGAKVVYASSSFDAKSTLRALAWERCTHMPAVPSLLYSLLDDPGQISSSLRHIEFSGAMVFAEAISQAKQRFDAEIVSTHFGMSESGPAAIWPPDHPYDTVTGENFVSPGLPVPGAMLRICAPGSRTPLKRGEPGEIHQSSPHLIKGYLNGASDEFYTDDFGRWFITGDQGLSLIHI